MDFLRLHQRLDFFPPSLPWARSLQAQVYALASSWRWRPSDQLLHCLPLHHIHGIVNALYCPAALGAGVEFLPKFAAGAVWQRLLVGKPTAGGFASGRARK